MRLTDSIVERFFCFDRTFFVKRDDLLERDINGNKARKFYHFAINGFGAESVISYGGAQSNAMYSLSVLTKQQGVQFVYYTKRLPSFLARNPTGNLAGALQNGMILKELDHARYDETISALQDTESTRLIRQGGADSYAKEGVTLLANELNEFSRAYRLQSPIAVVSSGTGTTAGYLSDALEFECCSVPAVADGVFLRQEMRRLGVAKIPTILETTEKIPFAKPHAALFSLYQTLRDAGIEFDLLYDTKCWLAIWENMAFFEGREVIFVHSGGTQANSTQLARYRHKGFNA